MGFYTTVKVVNNQGEPVAADVTCGGKNRGFTDKHSGEISFEVSSKDNYSLSAKRMGSSASGSIKGGQSITLRLA
jgi:hypothetical protein